MLLLRSMKFMAVAILWIARGIVCLISSLKAWDLSPKALLASSKTANGDTSNDEVGDFSEGFARVKQNGKYGCINLQGEVVIPCMYDWITDFFEGLSKVEQGRVWSVINKEGKVIVPVCDRSTKWSRAEDE